MQHQLIDIFLYDGIPAGMDPRYQSGNGTEDILIMQEDGSCIADIIREPNYHTDTTIPLFPMGERWVLSHRAPPGLHRRIEKFLVNCVGEVAENTITTFRNIIADPDGHLVCSWDMKRYRDKLEGIIWDRRIIYTKGLPGNCIISLPSREFTGVLADQEKDGIRSVGSFLMKYSLNRYTYIGSGN